MPTRTLRSSPLWVASACALLLWGGRGPACADDPGAAGRTEPLPVEAADLAAKLEEALTSHDKQSAERLLAVAGDRHNRCPALSVRQRLQRSVVAILQDEAMGGARMHAADALGRIDDKRVAWEALRRAMPETADGGVGPLGLRVLRALGYLAYEPAIDHILRFAQRSEDPNAVGAAAEALAEFRFAKRREKLLVALVELGGDLPQRARPTKDQDAGQVRQAWARAGSRLVASLGKLTGRRVPDLEGWRQLVEENRGRLDRLFDALPAK